MQICSIKTLTGSLVKPIWVCLKCADRTSPLSLSISYPSTIVVVNLVNADWFNESATIFAIIANLIQLSYSSTYQAAIITATAPRIAKPAPLSICCLASSSLSFLLEQTTKKATTTTGCSLTLSTCPVGPVGAWCLMVDGLGEALVLVIVCKRVEAIKRRMQMALIRAFQVVFL